MAGPSSSEEEIWRTAATLLQSGVHPAIHVLRAQLGGSAARIQTVMRDFWAEAGRQMLVQLETGGAARRLSAGPAPAPASAGVATAADVAMGQRLEALLLRVEARLGALGPPTAAPLLAAEQPANPDDQMAAAVQAVGEAGPLTAEQAAELLADAEHNQIRVDQLNLAVDNLQRELDEANARAQRAEDLLAKRGGAAPAPAGDAQLELSPDTGASPEDDGNREPDLGAPDVTVFGKGFVGPATFTRRPTGRH